MHMMFDHLRMAASAPNAPMAAAGGGATTAAAAAMAALSCGMSPTDPRLQPFLKLAQEDQVQLHTRVLISNGVPEAIAREQAERAAGDRQQFFGQAVLKYFSSLTGGLPTPFVFPSGPSLATPAPAASPFVLEPSKQQPFVNSEQPVAPSPPLLQPSEPAPPLPENNKSASATGVAKVMANVQFNLTRARSSRFDVPATAAPPQRPSLQLLAPLFTPMSSPANTSQTAAAHQLDRSLQQWTYRVFSALQTPPVGMDAKQWRAKVSAFVNSHVAQVRTLSSSGHPLPSWLTTCIVPSISEVLGQSPDSFVVRPPSTVPPPPPGEGGMSPVSSSASSSSDRRPRDPLRLADAQHLKRRHRSGTASSSSSAMSSSSSPSPEPAQRAKGKKARVFMDMSAQSAKQKPVRRVNLKKGLSFADLNGNGCLVSLITSEELKRRGNRMRRFGLDDSAAESEPPVYGLTWQEKLALLSSTERVVGRSTELEKPYLRLCGPPDPFVVRPEHVLKQSFRHCLSRWEREKNYRYIEEQFRSIRQDLTVQGIHNLFTVEVYEANARVALQNADLGQFNQCQTQLRELHRQLDVQVDSQTEFLCYRILYLSLTNMRQDLLKLLGELTEEEKRRGPILFAFAFRKALTEGNFHRTLRMSTAGPYLSGALISIFLDRLRMMYLHLVAKSHYTASVEFLQKELMFRSQAECQNFLIQHKAVWTDARHFAIDCRRSLPYFEASSLLQTRKMNALG